MGILGRSRAVAERMAEAMATEEEMVGEGYVAVGVSLVDHLYENVAR